MLADNDRARTVSRRCSLSAHTHPFQPTVGRLASFMGKLRHGEVRLLQQLLKVRTGLTQLQQLRPSPRACPASGGLGPGPSSQSRCLGPGASVLFNGQEQDSPLAAVAVL